MNCGSLHNRFDEEGGVETLKGGDDALEGVVSSGKHSPKGGKRFQSVREVVAQNGGPMEV